MRVLLINPYYPIDETPTPPLGLAFLGAALEEAGVSVRILDFVVYPYSRGFLEEEIEAFQPDVIGATAVTMTVDHALEVIRDSRSVAPSAFTVMGGPHVTFRAEETLAACAELDCVVPGEGESTLADLCRTLDRRGDLSGVAGIVYRHADGTRRTAERPLCPHIDDLPMPARHLLPLGRYRALNLSISMTTSRGCPFPCIFCVGRKMVGAKVRYRNPKLVVDELEAIGRLGFQQVNLADDLFTANDAHCHGVCDEIIRRGLVVQWTSFARVDTVSLPVLKKMKTAGCTAVSFGFESGNAEILKTIRKKITLSQVKQAVTMCNAAGIIPHGSFILGLPGETSETVAETLAFGEKLESMGVAYGFHLLAPFPGTEVRDRADEYGVRILTDDWKQYHANRSVVDTGGVAPEKLDDIVVGWKKRFDAWLGDVERRMETGEATEDEAAQLVNLKRTVLTYDLMMDRSLEKFSGAENGDAPLPRLAEALSANTAHSPDALSDALGNLHARGLIQSRDGCWSWVD
jgi:radical SAM superfamily enzyme YgiQ (UPF0313 family)